MIFYDSERISLAERPLAAQTQTELEIASAGGLIFGRWPNFCGGLTAMQHSLSHHSDLMGQLHILTAQRPGADHSAG